MKYKLKHLSKFCCKPANELEFEAVKMAAKLGGVKWCMNSDYYSCEQYIRMSYTYWLRTDAEKSCRQKGLEEIHVLDFIKKLRMTEEEAEKIEDNRINLTSTEDEIWYLKHDNKAFYCEKGYQWRLSKDKREVTLQKTKK